MLYDVNTKEKYEKRVNEMLEKGYIFPNNVKPDNFEYAKNCYHGNSKLLLHTFYNSITRKKRNAIYNKECISIIYTYSYT